MALTISRNMAPVQNIAFTSNLYQMLDKKVDIDKYSHHPLYATYFQKISNIVSMANAATPKGNTDIFSLEKPIILGCV